MLYPLTFQPIFKERLWGNRALQSLYRKRLPSNVPIGESWEITDRPEGISVVDQGPLKGKDLHWVVEHHREELMGSIGLLNGRFPILAKILDAHDTLSLQVHPPPDAALRLHGEPKTEMWYVAQARPGAQIYAGLKRGVTREGFAARLSTGGVAECAYALPVQAGAAMFVPSGRVHGIGAGCVIFEIQQSSDTTYRVFDWNRVGPDGQARELHIPQSLASIDFEDFEPGLIQAEFVGPADAQVKPLVSCPFFDVELQRLAPGAATIVKNELVILAVVHGQVRVEQGSQSFSLQAGDFCLLPVSLPETFVRAASPSEVLVTRPK